MKYQSANAASIREHNLSLVLNLVRRNGSISRSDIIRETNLSATAVSALVNVLIESGFVQEAGVGESSGGRRPVILKFDYNCRYVIGVDLGASHITVIGMDLQGRTISRQSRKYNVIPDPQGSIHLIKAMINQVMQASTLRSDDVLGIGVTIPTPLDGEKLDRLMTYYMPAWEGVVLPAELHQTYHLPVYLDNDANAGAVAEKWWGLGRDFHSLAYVKLGVGVGSGLVIKDEVYRGFNGAAGEIGHTTIEPNGRLCRCGNYGCLEAYAGAPGIITDVVAGRRALGLPDWPAEQLTVERIVTSALEGDPVCRQVIQNVGNYLGVAIANLLNLINPGLIVFGGDLVEAGNLLFDAVHATVLERAIPIMARHARLVPSRLGNDGIAVGAATMVIHNAFQPDRLYHTLRLMERR